VSDSTHWSGSSARPSDRDAPEDELFRRLARLRLPMAPEPDEDPEAERLRLQTAIAAPAEHPRWPTRAAWHCRMAGDESFSHAS
jgi:hypothetical protein